MGQLKDSSVSSTDSNIVTKEKQLQIFVKQMLINRLFIGTFQEKRYVDALKSYRDVIVISKEETELIRDVEVVKNRIRHYYNPQHWIGMTTPDIVGAPAGYCLWVELPEEVFGSYWYKISKIKFRSTETLVRLKIIRPISSISTNASLQNVPDALKSSQTSVNRDSIDNLQENLSTLFIGTGQQFKSLITVDNTVAAVKLLFLLLVAFCTLLVKATEFLGNFTLRLMNESSGFINSVTPIIISFINLIGKIIGGFYLLVLSMWRDRKGYPPVYNTPTMNRFDGVTPYNKYNTVYYRRALPPARGAGPVITPLD